MKKKIRLLIIGKNSFISSNIFLNLRNKIYIKKIKYSEFIKKKRDFLSKFCYILNCSLHKRYVLNKYNKKYDLDYCILRKINNLNINYIFLSTRKVYAPKLNIRETEKISPQDNYAKNKIITENYIKKIFRNNYLILRLSNVIGMRLVNDNKSHNLFLDNFILSVKKNFLLNHQNVFKDFISINQFVQIFLKILQINLHGVYNVSLGRKVYVSEILRWLTSSCKNSLNVRKSNNNKTYNSDSFTLDNTKLKKALNISINKKDLKTHCLRISKKIFSKTY
jgi:nucleoside-diphosphate-sugar epimerase